jgi:hypothetical protein
MKKIIILIAISAYLINIVKAQQSYIVNGYFTYDNSANTPLDSINVYLLNLNRSILDSTQSDTNGFYQFHNVQNGTYFITAKTNKPWSWVNSTDAVNVKKHFAGSPFLTSSILLHAADVNLSLGINSTDAIKITRRFVGSDTSFTSSDWVFEKPFGGDTINVSTNLNNGIMVNGANVSQNFKGRCVGDVN